MSLPDHFIIVIGASAGGFPVVQKILENLPGNLNSPVFVVFHVPADADTGVLIRSLQKNTALKCSIAENNTVMKPGHMYLAPADQHLLIKREKMILTRGARENRFRPSIDVLFRSAAVSWNSKVIGIIASGLLNDGTGGMVAIKKSGGICIVQEPEEAEFDSMPLSVLNKIIVNYNLKVGAITEVLIQLTGRTQPEETAVPPEILLENDITESMGTTISVLEKLGRQSPYSCPDCGGMLFQMNDEDWPRFRCFTGHVYTLDILFEKQRELLEETLWTAVRMLEEKLNLLEKKANDIEKTETEKKNSLSVTDLQITKIKSILIELSEGD